MSTVTAPATGALGRDDLLRLGGAGRPWDFLSPAMAAVQADPDDADLRLLLSANAATLGLGTLAREQLEGLPARMLKRSDVAPLLARLDELGEDEISSESRLETLRANLEALASRDVPLLDRLDEWRAHDEGRRWFRAADGNVPRLRDGAWERIGDQMGEARRFVQTNFVDGAVRPLVVEGLDPPWLVQVLDEVTPRKVGEHRPRLTLMQADPVAFMDGLAHADLTELLRDERLTALVGADASERLAQILRDRFETQFVGPVIPLAGEYQRLEPAPAEVMSLAEAAQVAEHQQLLTVVREMYAGRDASWWAARYAGARSGDAEPLRVLIPTCRYSTFIQHSAADLASAFQGAGCRVEVLIEPDDSSHHSSLAYLRVLERFAPDLVVLINYTRAHLGELFPAELPFVCWMQDAMTHHYDPTIGAKQTDLDFLVGHLPAELFDQYGYPRERALRVPVVASTRTFHDAPATGETARRFECEIAWVSHHSEEPEAMHERLREETGPELAPVLDALRGEVERIALGPVDEAAGVDLRSATRNAVASRLGREDEQIVTQLFRLYARPLADRMMRHQTLAWAADIADERSWRLRVHGRGWESHPRFSRYAAGELAHDDELRACYQQAGVHLHMTFSNLVHQRIMECALSGGLPLCRLSAESIVPVLRVMRIAAAQNEPVERDESGDEVMLGFDIDGTPESAAMAAMLRDLGVDVPPIRWVRERTHLQLRSSAPPPEERRADWLLGDLRKTTFTTKAQLEALIERALEDRAWRTAQSTGIAGRVRERLTDDVLAQRMLSLVRTTLGVDA